MKAQRERATDAFFIFLYVNNSHFLNDVGKEFLQIFTGAVEFAGVFSTDKAISILAKND